MNVGTVGPFQNYQVSREIYALQHPSSAQNKEQSVSDVVTEVLDYNFSIGKIRKVLAEKPGTMSVNARSFAVAKAAKEGKDYVIDLLLNDGPVDPRELNSAVKKAAKKGHTRAVLTLVETGALSVEAMQSAKKKAAKFTDGRIVALLDTEIKRKA